MITANSVRWRNVSQEISSAAIRFEKISVSLSASASRSICDIHSANPLMEKMIASTSVQSR